MNQQKPYASCSYCGSSIDEQHVRTEIWIGDQLTVFEHVPVGVCVNCGEEYFRADIHDKMLEMFKHPTKKNISVPVYSFTDPLAVAKAKKKKAASFEEREQEIHLATEEEIQQLSEYDDQNNWEEL